MMAQARSVVMKLLGELETAEYDSQNNIYYGREGGWLVSYVATSQGWIATPYEAFDKGEDHQSPLLSAWSKIYRGLEPDCDEVRRLVNDIQDTSLERGLQGLTLLACTMTRTKEETLKVLATRIRQRLDGTDRQVADLGLVCALRRIQMRVAELVPTEGMCQYLRAISGLRQVVDVATGRGAWLHAGKMSLYEDLRVAHVLAVLSEHLGMGEEEARMHDQLMEIANQWTPAYRLNWGGVRRSPGAQAYILSKEYQRTGDPVCRALACYWTERHIEMIAQLPARDTSLIKGRAGAALMLIGLMAPKGVTEIDELTIGTTSTACAHSPGA